MSVEYLGSLSTAQIVPVAASSLSAVIADLEAQITALVTATATVDFGGIEGLITLAGAIAAALEAAIAAGVTAPTVSFQATAVIDLKAKLEILVRLQNQMLAGGIHALRYSGRADDLGPEIASAVRTLPGVQPSDRADAIVLVATTPAAIAALAASFL